MNRTELFSAIRPFAPNQRFQPEHVSAIDALADAFGLSRLDGAWLHHALPIIKEFEGCRLTAYPDPGSGGDPWTIGWGSTGAGIKRGVTWTQAQADARLATDVAAFGSEVDKALAGARTTPQQKAAMVSLAYNVGMGNLRSSTLLKKHRAGDYAGAQAEFARWNKAAGNVMAGLTRRRAAEAGAYGS